MECEEGQPQDAVAFFGSEVRHAREHAGMTQLELATEAAYDRTYVARVEGGGLLGSKHFAETCDRVFKTNGYFVRLRARVSQRGHPAWFLPYVEVEKTARSISDYSNAFVMGLVQTPRYAEALFRAAHPRETGTEIAARVEARLTRQDIMKRESPPLLWMIVHEAALRVQVGSREIMAEQLTRLADEASSPHVKVQVLPNDAGAPAVSVSFILVDRDESEPKVYSETFGQGHLADDPESLRRAGATYDRLRASALSPERSIRLIRRIAEEFSS
ncbi:Scr1 family TA system antitoxin-like transcriptional regulator [Streptomyces sp. NPDC057702]|uniref:helix-turn-helix domain-containing protein n=1 Tax=unclassified Streptomyces TaxID=2593676 RepID=UPI0036B2C599